jgi:hypothetical protein
LVRCCSLTCAFYFGLEGALYHKIVSLGEKEMRNCFRFGKEPRRVAACGAYARAGAPAPQCGTGVLARQIAENGLEISQTPYRCLQRLKPVGFTTETGLGTMLGMVALL